MKADIYPLTVLLASFSGWLNRQQQQVIEYLVKENRVLKEQLHGQPLRLNNDQRRRVAAKGKPLGRRLLHQVATIVTPGTILRWRRKPIAEKWTYSTNRVGRPGLMKHIRELIVRFALENSNRGCTRIEGALKNVGHKVPPPPSARR